ncbi:porin [Ectothiorhodospira lacustris]|uniref:porin n=1 Tax=Ectothiorhodospira lacustris TaxID=2899127 RepID=UPI001EE8C3A7|nr:porin [Ectothiorhodospira lacustris]MCG5508898.1 porin [Ectothiorhodospira lacustris]MCG5520689.1 porin [Ectothiorhodospira lacustris]
MQKKVLVFAVAAAMGLPAAAMADTTLYGRLNLSTDIVDNGEDTTHQLASNSSRLGVRGSEDLGNGLRGVFQIEAGLQGDSGSAFGSSNLTGRNTYVGLAGGFGEVRVGKHDTPYKLATLPLNFFADTLGDVNHVTSRMASNDVSFYRRNDNTLLYLSPDLDGLRFMASYTTDVSDDRASNADANDQKAFSLAGTFTQGPMYVTVAYEQLNNWDDDNNARAWKVGGTYQIDALTLAAMYENIDSKVDDIGDRDAFHLGAKYQLGQAYLMGSYTYAGEDDRDNTDAQMYALGAGYSLSRRTGVYAVFAQVLNESGVGTGAAYGLNGSGKGKGVTPFDTGDNPAGFSVGVTHNF